MKYILLFLLLPFASMGQKPMRQYFFSAKNEVGLYTGEVSLSPRGNMLLATFSDFKGKSVYELVSIADNKLLASGSFPISPHTVAWSDDEKMVAIGTGFDKVYCYEAKAGMKQLFSTTTGGLPAFSRNGQLITNNFTPVLYVFGDEMVHLYNTKGALIDSAEADHLPGYEGIWFDLLNNRLAMLGDGKTGFYTFSQKDKQLKLLSGPLSEEGEVKGIGFDKDGAKFFYYDENDLYIHSSTDGKKIMNHHFSKIKAACFTPDSKNILVSDEQSLSLLSLQGKLIASGPNTAYFSFIFYTAFGTELVAGGPYGFVVYPCKDYFPVKEQPVVTNQPVTKPPVKIEPVVPVKQVPEVKEKPWPLTYKILDFIAPLNKDSFYLYSSDRALRYYIKYEKGESSILWSNPVNYFQYFGFSKDAKYQMVNSYILDMTDSTARLASYARSGLIEKPQMIGGQNFLGKIAASGKESSWPMNVFDEQYVLSAKVIDNTYKGKKAKCLTVERNDPKNSINEIYFYQQGIGLIKIESNGKVVFER